MAYDGLVGEDDDDNHGELVVTFGMLRSDLIDMLATIFVSSSGLEDLIKTNTDLPPSAIRLLATAIENYSSLTDVFSLGGEISTGEINAGARKIYARVDMLNQMQEMRESLRKTIMEDQNLTLQEKRKEICDAEELDPYIVEVFGEEYC
jgi:hypothetical protein